MSHRAPEKVSSLQKAVNVVTSLQESPMRRREMSRHFINTFFEKVTLKMSTLEMYPGA